MKNKFLVSVLSACLFGSTFSQTARAETLEEVLIRKGVLNRGDVAAVSESSAPKIYWKNGTKIDFPDAGVTFGLNVFMQNRYTFTDVENGDNTSSFDINRARLIAAGSVLNKEFDYYLQSEFAEKTSLKDAFLKWNASKSANARIGQYKVEVSRQFNASDYALQFADRSAASEYFDMDRNQGLEGNHNISEATKVGAAIFNGQSTGEGINSTGVDTRHLGVLFGRSDLVGKMDAFKEGDVENTESLAINVGGAYAFSDFVKTSEEPASSVAHDAHKLSVDANMKHRGTSVHTEFFWAKDEPEGGQDSQPLGAYVQAGHFLTPKHLEVVGRYSLVSCDDGQAGGDCSGLDQIQEATAGLNYYFMGHNLKAQLNYVYRKNDAVDGADENENRIIAQLSAYL